MPKQSISQIYSCSSSPTYGHLYLGNLQSAQSLPTLQKLSIRAIITVAKSHKLTHSSLNLPDYLYLPAKDQPDFDLTLYFEQSYNFIEKCLGYTNVLVHCVAGISRSASVVVAYLMRRLRKGAGEVVRMVKERREMVNPNAGFKLQLRFYESRLREERRRDEVVKKIYSMGKDRRVIVTQPLPSNPSPPLITTPPSYHQPPKSIHQSLLKNQPSNKSKLLQSRRISFSHRQLPKKQDVLKKGISLDKFRKKNLKLESNKKSFQKMIEINERRVEERLSKILTISNI